MESPGLGVESWSSELNKTKAKGGTKTKRFRTYFFRLSAISGQPSAASRQLKKLRISWSWSCPWPWSEKSYLFLRLSSPFTTLLVDLSSLP